MKSSIVVLVNGDTVITNLQEVFKGEGDDKKAICLMMNHPYKVDIVSQKKKNKPEEVQVQFTKWCPYSKDFQYKIPYDSVVTIGAPEDGLRDAYEAKVKLAEEKMKKEEVVKEYASDVTVVGAGMR